MNPNPMQKALAALKLAPKCGAHCRTTGEPCKNAQMANGRCRMHGGKSPGAPRGKKHGRYSHGRSTIKAKEERAEWQTARAELIQTINTWKPHQPQRVRKIPTH